MLKLYDTITLVEPLEDSKIPVGTIGTILMIYDKPSKVYLVELFTSDLVSLGVFEVRDHQIKRSTE